MLIAFHWYGKRNQKERSPQNALLNNVSLSSVCFNMKKILKSLPPIRWLLDIRHELALIRFQASRQTRIQQHIFRELKTQSNGLVGKSFPATYEHQTYSQNGEDGIIQEILKRLGKGSEYFVEIGSGDGMENNTRMLLELGWEGLWMDGEEKNCSNAKNQNTPFVKSGALKIKQTIVTAQNINDILKNDCKESIDIFSLDVDLNTYHVWEAISKLDARIVILEYNGFFPAQVDWISEHQPDEWWEGGIHMGASLKSLTALSKQKGYRLVGCDLSGTNAFFVREDLAVDHFPKSGNPDLHFEPARPFLLNNPEHRMDLS
jgi:hypothetical protein